MDGMFAFTIWDENTKVLQLYRDRIGKKPLYYYFDENDGMLIFGSEIKAVLQHPAYPKEVNYEAIYHYLSMQYVPSPLTAFEGIKQLMQGHYLSYEPRHDTKPAIKKYWQLEPQRSKPQDVRSMVIEAVEKRLTSERPLGVYLSGGVDSAIITACMREILGEGIEIHTFSIGFEDEGFNELPYANHVAKQFNTIHHTKIVRPNLPEIAAPSSFLSGS